MTHQTWFHYFPYIFDSSWKNKTDALQLSSPNVNGIDVDRHTNRKCTKQYIVLLSVILLFDIHGKFKHPTHLPSPSHIHFWCKSKANNYYWVKVYNPWYGSTQKPVKMKVRYEAWFLLLNPPITKKSASNPHPLQSSSTMASWEYIIIYKHTYIYLYTWGICITYIGRCIKCKVLCAILIPNVLFLKIPNSLPTPKPTNFSIMLSKRQLSKL